MALADTTPAPSTVDFSGAGFTSLTAAQSAIVQGGVLKSQTAARSLLSQFLPTIHSADSSCDINKSTFIVNIVSFNPSGGNSIDGFSGLGAILNSNWYIFNASQNSFVQASGTALRIYGDKKPYIVVIHLNSDISQFSGAAPAFALNYQYTVAHRDPANVQDLELGISMFKQLVPAAAAPAAVANPNFWTWGQLSINTPAGVAITGGLINPTSTKTASLDKAAVQFDDEGFYHWDISIGVPITSYTQLQQVQPVNGVTPVPANLNERNLILLGDFYVAPVDLQGSKLNPYPYLVGGISFASKPLHNAMVGIGYGFNTTALYVGTMIVTSDIASGQKKTNYKLAFGINFPIRTIMGKLGLNTEITTPPSK